MNKTYVDISLDHLNAMSESAQIVFEAKMIEAKIDKDAINTKFVKYPHMQPDRDGYADQVLSTVRTTQDAINVTNKNCVDDCVNHFPKTPIGLSVPTRDIDSDEDIKKYYDELRQVLHDEYTSVKEGGEGWVKFIDTLATPEERAENYKIPTFDSVYNQFISDKKISAVSKADIQKAIKTISEYDKKMGQIIKESEEVIDQYHKDVCLLAMREPAETFEECMKSLAEVMYIIESDYLMAMCIEARKIALTEACRDAQIILYSHAMHDPRALKESSYMVEMGSNIIDQHITDIIYDPDNSIAVKVVASASDETVNKVVDKIIKTNKEFAAKNKDRASQCNGVGVFADLIKTSDKAISGYAFSTIFTESATRVDRLQSLSEDALKKTYDSISSIRRAVIEKCDSCIGPLRDAFKKVHESLFENGELSHTYSGTESRSITKEDISEAFGFMESGFMIRLRVNELKELTAAMHKNTIETVESNSSKSQMIKKIQNEAALSMKTMHERYITELTNSVVADNLNAAKIITAATRSQDKNEEFVTEICSLYAELKKELLK